MPDPPASQPPAGETPSSGSALRQVSRRLAPTVPAWVRSTVLHNWIQSGGILIAAAWGVYTFVWKDILVPAWQPAHLSLEASLLPVPGRSGGGGGGREMTLEVKATNQSSRRLYPLANLWLLSGIRRTPRQAAGERGDRGFLLEADQVLRRVGLDHAERAVTSEPGQLLAIGRLFDDDVIDPGASVHRSILVRIPAAYAAVELKAIVPLLTRSPDGLFAGRRLGWGLSESMEPLPLLCDSSHAAEPAPRGDCVPADSNIDQELKRFDPQKATMVQLQQIGLP